MFPLTIFIIINIIFLALSVGLISYRDYDIKFIAKIFCIFLMGITTILPNYYLVYKRIVQKQPYNMIKNKTK